MIRVLVLLLAAILGATSAQAAQVQRVVSPGGIEAWLVEDHRNPLLMMSFLFASAGSVGDPAGKEGATHLAASTLDEGAGDFDSQDFQGRLENLAAGLSFSAGLDDLHGSLKTLSANRDAATDLLRLALTRPRFDSEPVARVRAQIVSGLRQELEDPGAVAGRALQATMFGAHPYARPSNGTPESLARIAAADLRAVLGRLARSNLIVGAVGDITPAELGALLDRAFGALPARVDLPALGKPVLPAAPSLAVIRKPAPQSAIRIAQAGLTRDDPDYYIALIINRVMGGGMTSRLYDEVRDKRGLAYAVRSFLSTYREIGTMGASAGTANARAAETIAILRQQWAKMAAEGITAAELTDAKTYLTGSFPLQLTSSGRISEILVSMQREKLGIDYLDRRNRLIEAVSLDDTRRVAKRLFDPERLSVVVVGDPAGLESDRR